MARFKCRVEWSFTDDSICEHGDKACGACEDAGLTQVGLMLVAFSAREARAVGSVNGSGWEFPGDGCPYLVTFIHPDEDIDSFLKSEGIYGEEVG